MSHRSRLHRKRFVCGHRGYGKYCHRCADRKAQKQIKLAQKTLQRDQWKATFAKDEIDLQHLPKQIVLKARKVLAELSVGTDYWEVSGKRLNIVREIVRIPITRRYRLLCHHDGKSVKPLKIMSHEEYNPLFRNPKRLLAKLFSRDKSKR